MSELKERLKKIKWLRKIVRAVKSGAYEVVKPINRIISTYYLKHSKKTVDGTIKIGFLAQIPWSWDKLEPVYESARQRSDFEVYLFVVPEDNFDTFEIIPDYSDNYFIKKYPESIKLLDENSKCIDLVNYNLDYLFYQRPFDYRLPKMVRSKRMVRYVKCCYLPYGFTASDNFNNTNLNNEFFDNQYFLFMDSPYMKGLFEKKYHHSVKNGTRKVEYLGYPGLEKYLLMREDRIGDGYVTWTPRWSFDNIHGGSTFLEYKDLFLNFVRSVKRKVLFRPHPLIHAELIRNNIMTEIEWNIYLEKLRECGVVIDIDSPIDDILAKTEILITDFSTIIGSFLMTGRPVIYCENGIKFNPVYEEMKKYMFVSHNWNETMMYYEQLNNGIDIKKDDRSRYIDDNYTSCIKSGNRICDRIVEDAMSFNKLYE